MYILWVMFAFLLMYLVIAIRGPSIWDRLLGMSLISSKIIVIVLIFSSFQEVSYLLDYVIIYALSGFIGTMFIALYRGNKRRNRKKGGK